jgi:hypothetical protein
MAQPRVLAVRCERILRYEWYPVLASPAFYFPIASQ